MKKVIVLNGSPRANGNTKSALEHLLSGMKKKADFDVTEINLTKESLKPCLACDACKKNGGVCETDKATAALMEKVVESDVIVLGTPVYWWGVSAQLKTAIDKFYSKSDIMGPMHKKIILVAVGAAQIEDPQYDLIQQQISFICKHSNWELISYIKASAFKAGELAENTTVLKEIEMQGEKAACCLD